MRPLITQNLAYDNKNEEQTKGQIEKTLPISAKERCHSPSKYML